MKEKKCLNCGSTELSRQATKYYGNYRNNQEENLDLLCPNCHSLTPTYRRLNKNGRKGRK